MLASAIQRMSNVATSIVDAARGAAAPPGPPGPGAEAAAGGAGRNPAGGGARGVGGGFPAREGGGGEPIGQVRGAVAALVMDGDVEVAPQGRGGGDGEQQAAALGEQLEQVAEDQLLPREG